MPPKPAARFLESALLFTIVMHALGMVTMAALLLPGMPGGSHLLIADRAAYVAVHPWLWRIGWLGWQLTALSDLLLALSLIVTSWIPKTPAIITLIATMAGLVPDQFGQAMWTWIGTRVAHDASTAQGLSTYADFETRTFRLIAGYGTIGYLLAALGWSWCFAAADAWSRGLTRLSIATWGIFAFATVPIFLSQSLRPGGALTSVANAIAFVLLMIWLIWVLELVLRRSRPTTACGHWAPWRHPSHMLWARLMDRLANSRTARYIGEHLHAFAMTSDITDVIYINYLVPADRLLAFLPSGLELQRLGQNADHAMFSILIYRHGHFGPHCFGPLRRLWPNPIQSNWRIYVTNPVAKRSGVFFITTTITSMPHALATRILCDGVPMHVPHSAAMRTDESGLIEAILEPGGGTSPDLRGRFREAHNVDLPQAWRGCFESFSQMLAYCVPQDRALSPTPWYGTVARQEISLGIVPQDCVPVDGEVESHAVRLIVGNAQPVCFKIDRVSFRFLMQHLD